MKATDKLTIDQSFEPVGFWDEDWLKNTIKELDLHKMTPEQREIAERRILQHTQVMVYHQAQAKYTAQVELEKLKAEQKATKSEQEKIKAEQKATKSEQEKIKAEQKATKSEQEKIKAEQKAKKAEQEKIKAEQKATKAEQEKIKAEQEKIKAEQEKIKAEQEKIKAEQELKQEKINYHKLLIQSLLNLNISVQQIADSQNWTVAYVEELKKEAI